LVFHFCSEVDALFEESILLHAHDDMPFGGVGIKLVVLVAVFFQQDNRVLALCYFKVGLGAVQTKNVRTGAVEIGVGR
jgi:hypothetical protein